ncbi:heterokaryon incompatibility, partial [Lentithecium fluviatile CBS 122367]
MRCNLRNVQLNHSLKFHALSYVWGTEPPTHSITVNEKVDIKSNLYSALRRIQSQFTDLELWCDALCMNQDDSEEKNREVLRMGDIYRSAERVVIWLGKEEQKSDLAMSNIRKWGGFYHSLRKQPSALLQPRFGSLFDPAAWNAMRYLFERLWWFRIWI